MTKIYAIYRSKSGEADLSTTLEFNSMKELSIKLGIPLGTVNKNLDVACSYKQIIISSTKKPMFTSYMGTYRRVYAIYDKQGNVMGSFPRLQLGLSCLEAAEELVAEGVDDKDEELSKWIFNQENPMFGYCEWVVAVVTPLKVPQVVERRYRETICKNHRHNVIDGVEMSTDAMVSKGTVAKGLNGEYASQCLLCSTPHLGSADKMREAYVSTCKGLTRAEADELITEEMHVMTMCNFGCKSSYPQIEVNRMGEFEAIPRQVWVIFNNNPPTLFRSLFHARLWFCGHHEKQSALIQHNRFAKRCTHIIPTSDYKEIEEVSEETLELGIEYVGRHLSSVYAKD